MEKMPMTVDVINSLLGSRKLADLLEDFLEGNVLRFQFLANVEALIEEHRAICSQYPSDDDGVVYEQLSK